MLDPLLGQLTSLAPLWVYLVAAGLVFVEDAVFVGFLVPGETAAVLVGVDASRGHVELVLAVAAVVLAAVLGDSAGYEVGRRWGGRLLRTRLLQRRRPQLDAAAARLADRGGSAVLAGRFFAFGRAAMPALAGASRMPYRRFLAWNGLGGLVWGTAAVLVGYLAGDSYRAVTDRVGPVAAGLLAVVVLALVVRHRLRQRRQRAPRTSGPAL